MMMAKSQIRVVGVGPELTAEANPGPEGLPMCRTCLSGCCRCSGCCSGLRTAYFLCALVMCL